MHSSVFTLAREEKCSGTGPYISPGDNQQLSFIKHMRAHQLIRNILSIRLYYSFELFGVLLLAFNVKFKSVILVYIYNKNDICTLKHKHMI